MEWYVIENKESLVICIFGMKCHAQKTPFIIRSLKGDHTVSDIKERGVEEVPIVINNPDYTNLIHNKDTLCAIVGDSHSHWMSKTFCNER